MEVEEKRNYFRCSECSHWHWSNGKCADEYFVSHDDYMGDETETVRAYSYEGAALEYGKAYNEDGYILMDGTTINIKVERNGVCKYFKVGAEPDIHYKTQEIDGIEYGEEI